MVTVPFLPRQVSLNSTMDSLKAELNTALQCDREAEEEVKKLKVDTIHPPAHLENIDHLGKPSPSIGGALKRSSPCLLRSTPPI